MTISNRSKNKTTQRAPSTEASSIKQFLVCALCGRILPVFNETIVEIEGEKKHVCIHCAQKIERQDTRELLEEST